VPNGKLEYSVEHHSPAAGVTPIKAEHELAEVVVQVRVVDGTFVCTENPPLGQPGNSVHGGQQLRSLLIAATPGRALTARFMAVAVSVQSKVAFPAVRDDGGAWLDVIADESVQGCSRGVNQRRDPASPVATGLLDLHRDARQDLVAPAFATANPGSRPPMHVSSTTTAPTRRSRPGHTSKALSR
jgi:hypothetical protein